MNALPNRSIENQSFTRRLAAWLAVTVIVVSAIAVTAMYYVVSLAATKDIEHRADEVLAYLVGTLETPLWAVDYNGIKAIGAAVSNEKSIVRLIVRNESGVVVYANEKTREGDLTERTARIFHEQGNKENLVGEVSVSLTHTVYQAGSRQLMRSSAIIIVLILSSVVIVAVVSIRASLKRLLKSLNEIADRFAAETYNISGNALPYREFQPFGGALVQMARTIERQIEAIRVSEGKYRNIFENAREGMLQSTVDGRFLAANPALVRILGYASADDLVARVGDIGNDLYVDPEQRGKLLSLLRERGAVDGYEAQLRRKDGNAIWVSMSVRTVCDETGRVLFIEGFLIDITERKQAEAALRESEQRYRLVLENSPISIWEEDFSAVKALLDDLKRDGVSDIEAHFARHPEIIQQCADLAKIVNVNRAALTLHGSASKEELLAGLVNTFTPESFDTFRLELICLWNGGTEMVRDAVVKTLAGTPLNVTVYFSVCPGYEKTLSKVLVSLADITERKRAEEEINQLNAELEQRVQDRTRQLAASEERMRHFFERQLVGMAITSPEKGWIQVNDKICEMMGYSRAEMMRLSWAEMTYPEDLAPDVTQFERMLRGEIDSYMLEKRFIRKDGSIVFTNLAVGCVRRVDRSVDYVLALLEDITERKRAEASILELNVELRQRAKALEDANKELEAFSYSVSHDLRAPLRHIDGFLGLLQERIGAELDEKSWHYMATISDAARRMGMLIDDLLAFSRMGRNEMTAADVDLDALVQEIIREFELETKGRAVAWRVGELPVVIGDRAMLRVVLDNLISNALKFTQQRAQTEIEIGCLPGQDKETVVFVRDNGAGFDMQYVDKLFGVFQRLHGVDEFEGTGIGLANVRRVVGRHGGRTWAEGKVDGGATFYFSLPRARQAK